VIKQNGMRLGLRMTISAAAIAILCGSVSAQTTDTTTTPDLNQLLQQFGGLFGLGGTTGITTTPSTTDTTTGTTTDTTTGTDTGTGMGTGPQPTIIGNRFTTTTGGALGLRRPGLMIQHSFAVQNGTETIPGDFVDTPSFARATVDEIALNFLDTISSLIQSLNLLGSAGDIFNPGGSGGGVGFTGAATTGGGTTTPIS
jgi:hypothetical protein